MKPLRIVLVGEESAGRQVLERVARTDHELVAVLTSEADGAIAKLAARLDVEVLPAQWVKELEFAAWLDEQAIDVLLNVHSLYIVRGEAVGAPPLGSFNLHPGPLPEYAGLNCVSWAIYEGAAEYGVTLHEMVATIDAGDVVSEVRFPIESSDTPFTLATKCIREGVPLVVDLVDKLATDPESLERRAQDQTGRRYYDKSVPRDGLIDWDTPTEEVLRFIRAFDYFRFESPWGRPKIIYRGDIYEVKRALPSDAESDEAPGVIGQLTTDGIPVGTADGSVVIAALVGSDGDLDPADLLTPGESLG
ncbi:MAG: methionyl-tRNA formyltransferase [Acidimicrobiales bacterium]